ncbi:MAG: MATE family efflux transporter [Clostridia bacterium]|nr:MATE family efflux transporter [Clostridia bacterium]
MRERVRIQISDHFNYRKLLKFVMPTIVMMIVTSIYGVIDGLFVSNFVGKTPFAALNLIMPFIMILGGMGFMIGTGGTALVSKVVGEGDREKANRYFTMVVIFAVLLGLFLTAVGIAVMRPIARLLGATDNMIEHCVLYGRIVVGFTTFFMLQNIFQSFLAAAEKPKLGLAVTLIAGCTNAALDALFIVVFRWGLVGAAVATGIGQVLGGVIPLVYFARKNSSLLRFTKTKLEIKPLLLACGNGSSELLTNVASSIVSMLYNGQLMRLMERMELNGENGVSAYGVLMYVQFIFLAIEIGYTIGSAPIVGYNYGAENRDELKNVFKKSILIMAVSGTVLTGLAQALAVPIAKLFVGYDEELYRLTVHAFRLFSFAFVFSGIGIYSSGFFTALNNGLISAILAILRSVVFQVAFVFLLPYLFGLDGIWWAMLATEVAAAIAAVVFFIAKHKKYGYA